MIEDNKMKLQLTCIRTGQEVLRPKQVPVIWVPLALLRLIHSSGFTTGNVLIPYTLLD